MFIDTHTHLYTEDFDSDCNEVIERARAAGAVGLLLPNIDEASIAPMLTLTASYPDLCFPMMGLHPTELPLDPPPLLDKMEEMLRARNTPFVAVGEVGIDLYWDNTRREEQITVFRRQAEWAAELHLPLMVHSRNAHRELIDTLMPLSNRLTGVFHCFGGNEEEARELLTSFPGFSLGIGGTLTFKKSSLPTVLRNAVPSHELCLKRTLPTLPPHPIAVNVTNQPTFR